MPTHLTYCRNRRILLLSSLRCTSFFPLCLRCQIPSTDCWRRFCVWRAAMESPPATRRWQHVEGGGGARLGSVVHVRRWASLALVATAGQKLTLVAAAPTPAVSLNCFPPQSCRWRSAQSTRTGPGWAPAGHGVSRDDWCGYGHSSGWVGRQRTRQPCMAVRRRRWHVGGRGMHERCRDRHELHAAAVVGWHVTSRPSLAAFPFPPPQPPPPPRSGPRTTGGCAD